MTTPCTDCAALPVCAGLLPPDQQPPDDREWGIDGVFVKQMFLARAGTLVPQHSHAYAHLSLLTAGSVRVWKDAVLLGEFTAPAGLEIEAHAKHTFLALEDGTSLFCIHNTARTGVVEIAAQHTLPGGV